MKLEDPTLMARYMEANKFSQARLARFAGCSRQFIWALLNGTKTTCSVPVGTRIEEALRVLPGTLFLASVSNTEQRHVTQHRTGTAA